MIAFKTQTTIEFIQGLVGFGFLNVSDLKIAKALKIRHSRSGAIQLKGNEGHGVAVLAYAVDDLGNVTALGHDGIIRQYV